MRERRESKQPEKIAPRTGVGTPDDTAEAGGAELGGDTGDVGTPRNEAGDSPGGTAGTSGTPEGSTVVRPGQGRGGKGDIRRTA